MAELFDQVSIEDPDDPPSSATIRINPPMGARHVHAFARLAAVVDRAGSTEIPSQDEPWAGGGIEVHARPPEPRGPSGRLRDEAIRAPGTSGGGSHRGPRALADLLAGRP